MAIYRGPGGAGDATVDATNNAALVAIRTQQATDAATAAAASAAEAASSAVIASTGLSGIAAYAAAAAGSAASADTSATSASTSASTATTKADTATTKANEASASAAAAATSASNAATSASNAATSASNAATSASNAASSATAANNSSINAANSATSAAASAASASGYLPSSTGNTGKYLRTNGTTNYWDNVTDVAAATITNDGVMFGFTDESTLQSTTTYTYNSTIYPQTPQNIVSGDGPAGHVAQTMAQAIINGGIVVGDPIKVTALKVSTNVVEEINLGTVSACSGLYNGLTSRWEFSITTTNPNSWNSSGYYNPGAGIYLYTIISGPISYGDENTQLGYNAGSGLTLGTKNVIIGSRSATNLGNGSNNIIIGQGAQGSAVDISNEITLGNSTHTKTRLFGALAVGGSATGTSGQVLTSSGSGSAPTWSTPAATGVTSVALSAPTGLTVSGSPVTTSGTLALTYTAGYSIPTTASQTNWDTAYGWGNHASAGYVTTSGARSAISATGSLSYNSTTGVISYTTPTTSGITEGTNLYYTDARARSALSASTGISYNSTTGAISSTITQYTDALARAAISVSGSLSYNSTTGVISYTTPSSVTSVTGTSPVVSSGGTTPAISLASGYGDTQNPFASKTANYILAAPNGVAGAPSFRALVAADVPTLNQNTTGTAANVTGTVAITNGGTGQTTQQAALNALAGAVTSGSYLRGNGTNVTLSTIQAADVPTLNQNTTGTASNVTGTVAIANGGTGQTTANAAFNALAPSQTSNSGKYLTTDGTNTSWATVNAGASLSNDTSTSTNLYPLFAAATTGTFTTLYTSNAKYLYKPSTGELQSQHMVSANGITVNSQTISTSYTIASGQSGTSAGPITISSGVTVTVSSGSKWVVL